MGVTCCWTTRQCRHWVQDSPNEETLEQKQGNHEGLSCDIFTVLSKPYVPSKLVVETSIYIRCLQFSVPLRSAVSGQPVFRHDRPIYIDLSWMFYEPIGVLHIRVSSWFQSLKDSNREDFSPQKKSACGFAVVYCGSLPSLYKCSVVLVFIHLSEAQGSNILQSWCLGSVLNLWNLMLVWSHLAVAACVKGNDYSCWPQLQRIRQADGLSSFSVLIHQVFHFYKWFIPSQPLDEAFDGSTSGKP